MAGLATAREFAVRAGYSSPGWKRAQERNFHGSHPGRGAVIEGEGRLVVSESSAASDFKRGERVFHQKFGYGKVLVAEGDKLEIAFDKAGVKKVMAGFVVPAEQAG